MNEDPAPAYPDCVREAHGADFWVDVITSILPSFYLKHGAKSILLAFTFSTKFH